MVNVQLLKKQKKALNLTYEELAKISNIPISTIYDLFRGVTKHPRIDTMQALERALGLSPEWTEEDRAQGVGKHAVVLSDEDERRLQLLWQAEETLGTDYVKAYLYALEIAIQQKQPK